MSLKHTPKDLRFGELQGIAPGGVAAYCSDYSTIDNEQFKNREAYRHYVDGTYTGYKWQCVEFARRWLLINTGMVFDDVSMAYDIFNLDSLKRIEDAKRVPLRAFKNGSPVAPEAGGMLIWQEGGEFEVTGHVAIIVRVDANAVYVAEQNASYAAWPADADYARSLPLTQDEQGQYWIDEPEHGTPVLGWMLQKDDESYSESTMPFTPSRLKILAGHAQAQTSDANWLDADNSAEKAYVHMMNGHKMVTHDDQSLFYMLSSSAEHALKKATAELHAQFLFAVDYVLKHPETWPAFNIPDLVWPKIQQSWNNRRNEVMTGRFDFCLSELGLKCYEYNADSASCYMESGRIQGKWADAFNVTLGEDSGKGLFNALVKAWQQIAEEFSESHQDPLHIHILYDADLEEAYHAKFMAEAMQQAGIVTHMQQGFVGLHRSSDGSVVDANGIAIKRVWKTWAWETALDQLREELGNQTTNDTSKIRLVDILLHDDVMVHEPLWTLLPSNKAILSILWQLFPDSPYLLETSSELTSSLITQGYVCKPIAGRCGANISIVDPSQEAQLETGGKFAHQDQVYQALFPLPLVAERFVQICGFCVNGSMHGLCTRIDEQAVITNHSDVAPLRIIPDHQHNERVIESIQSS